MISLNLLFAAVTLFLFIFLLTAFSNIFFYHHLRPVPLRTNHPALSICIPARNEGVVIGRTLAHLTAQPLENVEILVLDDNSTDQTAAVIDDYAQQGGRVRRLEGQPLPAGWLGKNWACHQLSRHARGDLLLFTDADVAWRPGSLAALLNAQRATRADLLSVWPTQITGSWSEWLVVPLMKFAVLAYLPLVGVHHTPWPAFAAANGQAILFKRTAYKKIGGHAAVKNDIVEDVALARAVKSAGGRLRLFDGGNLVTCRMYRSWVEVRAGFGKNLLAGHGGSVPFLLLSTVWHWLAFVAPWILILIAPSPATFILFGLALMVRWVPDLASDRRPLSAFTRAIGMPLGVCLMTLIAGQAIWWHYGRGPVWKGRHARV